MRRVAERDEEALRMEMIVDSAAHDSKESVVEVAVRLGDSLAESWGGATWLLGPPKNFQISIQVCKKITWAPPKVKIRPPHHIIFNQFSRVLDF